MADSYNSGFRRDSGDQIYTTSDDLPPGAANVDSETASYSRAYPKANAAIITGQSAVTVGAGAANDTMLMGLAVANTLTGNVAITGFANGSGAATTWTGTTLTKGFYDFKGAVNSAGALTMTCATTADSAKVMALWFPA